MNRHIIIGTAGHVDHGKTALVKALTGIDCDTHPQEKERGITINLGFAHITLPSGTSAGIVDVPGHRDFIRTMVAGVHGIDMVLLVISADEGVMPQTREHLEIINLMGVSRGVVALTKSDLVDDEMVGMTRLEVHELLEDTPLKGSEIVAVSALSGYGLNELSSALDKAAAAVAEKDAGGFFRMYVDRVFQLQGIGCVVTGSVLNGMARSGQELIVVPGGKKVRVRSIQRYNLPVDQVVSGNRAALNLTGIKTDEVYRGALLTGREISASLMADATFSMISTEAEMGLWTHGLFLTGTFECPARIHLITSERLKDGENAVVQIHPEKEWALVAGDRYVLRNSSDTITLGGGVIIDPNPLHHRRRTPALIKGLEELARSVLSGRRLPGLIIRELERHGKPFTAGELAEHLQQPAEEVIREIPHLDEAVIQVMGAASEQLLISREADERHSALIIQILQDRHKNHPLSVTGLEPNELFGKLGLTSSATGKKYLSGLLERMHQEGLILPEGNTWRLVSHQIQIDDKRQRQLKWLEETILGFGMQVPVGKDLEKAASDEKISREQLHMMLGYLVQNGTLIQFEGDFVHYHLVDHTRQLLLRELTAKPQGINEKEFRELSGATRRMVQVLIGIFLREGSILRKTFYLYISDKGREMNRNHQDF